MGFNLGKSLSRIGKSVSGAVQDAGESVGKTIAGSEGAKIGGQIGKVASYAMPGGQMQMASDVGKAVGGPVGGLIEQAGGGAGGGGVAQAAMGMAQGLPPTGIDQQLATLNQQQIGPAAGMPADQGGSIGSNNIQQLSRTLAQSYGLPIGKGNIVDENGNFLVTPQQLAQQSGQSVGDVAASMNMVSQALNRKQNEQRQDQGRAALETGLGMVQSRGRGSLAAMQSGFYQGLADMYSNQEYEAADFSYWIQKEKDDAAAAIQQQELKASKKNDLIGGALSGASIGSTFGPWGAAIGGGLGLLGASDWF